MTQICKVIQFTNIKLLLFIILENESTEVDIVNIAIIGGGSVGLLVSHYLAEHHQITLYVKREEQKKLLNTEPLRLIQDALEYETTNLTVKLIGEMDSIYDLFIICVKQAQINDILKVLRNYSFTGPLLFLQNGMGHLEALRTIPQSVYVGVVSHGAHRTSQNRVRHLGSGTIKLASLTGNEAELARLQNKLHDTNFPIEREKDWETLLKAKLIVNAVINPLTALFDVPNGKLIKNNHLRFLAKEICKETAVVLQLPFDEAWEQVVKTAEMTKDNVSSMRADVQMKRETEIEAITGFVLNAAKVDLPYTTFVYKAILALDQERTSS